MSYRMTLLLLAVLTLISSSASGQETLRIATWNIEWLDSNVSNERVANIKRVLSELDAHVIGLQEIADRAALERVFDPQFWHLVIDDDSTDKQDLALAVRRPLEVTSVENGGGVLDAEDDDFLFSGGTHPDVPGNNANFFFPNRRDVLAVVVETRGGEPFVVFVVHAKSRSGGRDVTDNRREGAARAIRKVLERDFDGTDYVLLGDFNDNPDDRSLNILETGTDNAPAGPEEIDGPFLTNLCEALVVEDHCSWGLAGAPAGPDGSLETRVAGTRNGNNETRGTGGEVMPILFDQLLVPVGMSGRVVGGTATIFNRHIAVAGGPHRPSDHLPVYADIAFSSEEPEDGAPSPTPPSAPVASVRIASLQPNPPGDDPGHEWIELENVGDSVVDLAGWIVTDRAGNRLVLTGRIDAGQRTRINLGAGELPLNNDGDELTLTNATGTEIDRVRYSGSDARSGQVVQPAR